MDQDQFWQGKRILIGIGGSIAAYKTCTLVSSLAKQGAEVRVVLTTGAEAFVSALTFATVARQPAYTDADFWRHTSGRPLHIDLAEWAEVILLAPLTANTVGKLAQGLADNLLTNILLASACPVLLAPAMNTQMWIATAVQRNWQLLISDPRFAVIPPMSGRLACDTVGQGRMAEPEILEDALLALVWTGGQSDWQGKQVLVSGGSTREPIDLVRFISNPASGRMGLALANAAAYRGAEVVFVHGSIPDSPDLINHPSLTLVAVTTAAEMHSALLDHFSQVDYLLMAAAVGDVRPAHPATRKLPKAELPEKLELELIPDILQDLSQHKRTHQKVIGFAAQTGDPVPPALVKLESKKLDAIVANPIDQPDSGFGSLWNQAVLLSQSGEKQVIPRCPKTILAHHILDFALRLDSQDLPRSITSTSSRSTT